MNLNDRFCAPVGCGAVGRYTTPTHTFTVPVAPATITALAVIYAQSGKAVLVKTLDDCRLGEKTISVSLSETDTSLFCAGEVQVQLRLGVGCSRLVSNVLRLPVVDVLQDGLLDTVQGGDKQ